MELKQYICRIIQDDTNILLIEIHLLFKEIKKYIYCLKKLIIHIERM